ncbi:hypothetical protein ACFQ8W_00545 [Streptomyces sp. NPDC056508]|uniref:hypothetical protein n=1 Tax=Streptomyces sp. NPDC056508 TaxID=3345845 RepID=UPI003684690B
MTTGARVEIVEPDHEPGTPLVPKVVRVNGVDVGALAKSPVVSVGDDELTTVTLVLYPSAVEIKGDDVRDDIRPIGFTAG